MFVSFLGSAETLSNLSIPLFLEGVSAGFPSPAQDFIERTLDLNELCIAHPAATFFVRVEGHSMVGVGIHSGDILRSEEHTSELQSRPHLVCRLLLEKKKKQKIS